eukprot:31198-Pelagococcus_subviridis.AAC.68
MRTRDFRAFDPRVPWRGLVCYPSGRVRAHNPPPRASFPSGRSALSTRPRESPRHAIATR